MSDEGPELGLNRKVPTAHVRQNPEGLGCQTRGSDFLLGGVATAGLQAEGWLGRGGALRRAPQVSEKEGMRCGDRHPINV